MIRVPAGVASHIFRRSDGSRPRLQPGLSKVARTEERMGKVVTSGAIMPFPWTSAGSMRLNELEVGIRPCRSRRGRPAIGPYIS
jgi:hypothetical protein